jgi:putative ATP-dependent endonuclease of OLD family
VAVIRKIEISHFRGIAALDWCPSAGINCLIGPGDSCKTTILDAIDFCLGARRNLALSDADFYGLDVKTPIEIAVTLGQLQDDLKNFEAYGLYLRGFDQKSGAIQDEPDVGLETVITVRLKVEADLEPSWSLVSQRAEDQGQSRNLSWADRATISPARLGAFADHNLSWGRASVLNKISDETLTASAALADLARDARLAFGQKAEAGLPKALNAVHQTAQQLGVPVGASVKAMLDAHSVSFSGGTIALHDDRGVPLKNFGLGSKRLLVAGLQRQAAGISPIVIVDELEHGLEPHRIIRLLHALGAKEAIAPLQVFMTTHSPVAVRELSAEQLFIIRRYAAAHHVHQVGPGPDVQGTIRLFPEALLARSVLICEGNSEIGLVRGVDQHAVSQNAQSITAMAGALVNGNGDETFKRALAFQLMGYRTAVLLDSDKVPTPGLRDTFIANGGQVFGWSATCALEDELFRSLPNDAAWTLLAYAVEAKGQDFIDSQLRSSSAGTFTLDSLTNPLSPQHRASLGGIAKSGKGWFKTVSDMEQIGRSIVGPALAQCAPSLSQPVCSIFQWFAHGRG